MFFSAVLVAANAALLDLADVARASDGDRGQLTRWLDRGRAGLASSASTPESGLCADYDVRAGEADPAADVRGFRAAVRADRGHRASAPPSCGCSTPRTSAATRGSDWRLLPSTSPAEPSFEPHNYWRGPVWPVIDWLLWQSLSQLGYSGRADEIRRESLGQIAAAGKFAEYFEPFTGKPLGSLHQSWTAAVALDWTA